MRVAHRGRVRSHPSEPREDGSILPLTIGYATLALAAVLVCVDATSLYLAQERLQAVADAATLAAADGFTLTMSGGTARAVLTPEGVREQAEALVREAGTGARLVSADVPDGVSARVTVSAVWHPPVLALFVADGAELRATATGRTALR